MSNLSTEIPTTDAAYQEALIAYESAFAAISSCVKKAKCPTGAEIEEEEKARAALASTRLRLRSENGGSES